MIRFDNVSKIFRRSRVLDAIHLDIGVRERVALIGSNGAGKTSLIRCLLGEYVHEGCVTVAGLEPREERATVLGLMGFVPQLPPPLKMPVGQLIDFSAATCGTDPARMVALAAKLGLDVEAIRTRPFVRLAPAFGGNPKKENKKKIEKEVSKSSSI